jgi:hypothetical protein
VQITDSFDIELCPPGDAHSTFFVLGGPDDGDMEASCLSKSRKTCAFALRKSLRRSLAYGTNTQNGGLSSLIGSGYGVDDLDRKLYKEQLGISHEWDRVILLDPKNHWEAFEI